MPYRLSLLLMGSLLGWLAAGASAGAQPPVPVPIPEEVETPDNLAPPESGAPATPEEPGAAPSAPAEPAPATPAAESEVWSLYHAAMVALASGETEIARSLLRRLREAYPDHPITPHVAASLEALDARANREPVAPPAMSAEPRLRQAYDAELPPLVYGGQPDAPRHDFAQELTLRLARAEFAMHQLALGVTSGVLLCVAADCEDGRGWTAATLGFGGLGVGFSIMAINRDIDPGVAHAIDWGAYLGLVQGYYIAEMSGWNDQFFFDERDHVAIGLGMLLGQISGMALGAGLGHWLEPTPGQVALAATGSTWTQVGTLMVLLAAKGEGDELETGSWLTLSVAMHAGLAAGMLLASHVPVSRGRAFLLDLGAGTGIGLGMASVVVARGEERSDAAFLITGAVGMVAGLSLAWVLTRDFDADAEPPVDLSFAPTRGGGLARLELQLR